MLRDEPAVLRLRRVPAGVVGPVGFDDRDDTVEVDLDRLLSDPLGRATNKLENRCLNQLLCVVESDQRNGRRVGGGAGGKTG